MSPSERKTSLNQWKAKIRHFLRGYGLAPYLDMGKIDAKEIDPLYGGVTHLILPLPKPDLEQRVLRDKDYDFLLSLQLDNKEKPIGINSYGAQVKRWQERFRKEGQTAIEDENRLYFCLGASNCQNGFSYNLICYFCIQLYC